MSFAHPLSLLAFFTLLSGIVVVGGALLYFLHSSRNRYYAEQALLGDGHRSGPAPDGALPELIGLMLMAFAAMALLAYGYSVQ